MTAGNNAGILARIGDFVAWQHDGSLQLSVRIAQPNATRVEVAITDTGKGMTPEDRARMFEPLFTTKSKGIGLGLALSKLLVEAHDGTISAASALGKGTTVTVTLPYARLATGG